MPPFKAGVARPPAASNGKAAAPRAKTATTPTRTVTREQPSNGSSVRPHASASASTKQPPARAQQPKVAAKGKAQPTSAPAVKGGKKRSREADSDEDGEDEHETDLLEDDGSFDDEDDEDDDDFAAMLRAEDSDDDGEDEDRKEADEDDEGADVEIKDFFSSRRKGWSDDEEDGDNNEESERKSAPSSTTRKQKEGKKGEPETKSNTAAVDTVRTDTTKPSAAAPPATTDDLSVSSPSSASVPADATFASLGVIAPLVEACTSLGWHKPTHIQSASLPHSLTGRDVIGLAETGSGKTAAFALPILQSLLTTPQPFHSLILAPTRELAFQIAQQTEALGASIGVRVVVLVGGVDMVQQSIGLAKKPHVICATPGRIVDHLENTKGFNMKNLKFLVLDEADRLLNMDFEKEIDTVLSVIPKTRQTFLFSATMTSKVAKLQRASLTDPIRCEVSKKYQVAEGLKQCYIFLPAFYKDLYLAWLCHEYHGQTMIIFTSTCEHTQHTTLVLRHLGFSAIPLHGKMPQVKRLGALNSFRSGSSAILVATDVASRGLDIPAVDCVINYDIPQHSKDYIHRVGRTARAGRTGKAITLVSQYDVELFQRIEGLLGYKLGVVEGLEVDSVMLMKERVGEAARIAKMEMRDQEERRRDKRGRWS